MMMVMVFCVTSVTSEGKMLVNVGGRYGDYFTEQCHQNHTISEVLWCAHHADGLYPIHFSSLSMVRAK